MALNKPVKKIAIVGTGVIGASWAAEFLAHGFEVVATDPAPNAEQNLRKFVDAAWPALTQKGLAKSASRSRLSFSQDMKKAVSDADFVQENGPERPDFKIKLFADIDAATPSDSLIASSSSGITLSVDASPPASTPNAASLGIRSTPPAHAVPLVEVVGGSKTSEEAVKRAIEFYGSIGKKPIHVRKEVVGHVANRLQAAIYREVVNLIHQGVVDVADADTPLASASGARIATGKNHGVTQHVAPLVGYAGAVNQALNRGYLSEPRSLHGWWLTWGRLYRVTPMGSKQTIVDKAS